MKFQLRVTGLPLQDFLSARTVLIHAMYDEGKSWEEICYAVNLTDPSQAERILISTIETAHYLPGLTPQICAHCGVTDERNPCRAEDGHLWGDLLEK